MQSATKSVAKIKRRSPACTNEYSTFAASAMARLAGSVQGVVVQITAEISTLPKTSSCFSKLSKTATTTTALKATSIAGDNLSSY
jgi:hypothetical protein